MLLVVLALFTAPRRAVPDAFFDVGETFFPEFTDPATATSLVIRTMVAWCSVSVI